MLKFIMTRRYVFDVKNESEAFGRYYENHPSLADDTDLYDVALREWTAEDHRAEKQLEQQSLESGKDIERYLAEETDL
jgi:hypothetical protein